MLEGLVGDFERDRFQIDLELFLGRLNDPMIKPERCVLTEFLPRRNCLSHIQKYIENAAEVLNQAFLLFLLLSKCHMNRKCTLKQENFDFPMKS